MKGVVVHVERRRPIRASADEVWKWMCDPRGLALFRANLFHADAKGEDQELRVGSQVRVEHHLGIRRELRIARISTLRPFEIAWSEVRADGRDWFPHHQKFVLTPLGDRTCELHNTLRGTFNLRGARWWLVSWYRYVLPLVLDLENRRIASATEGPVRYPDASG